MDGPLLSNDDYTKLLQNLYKTTEVQFLRAQLKPISANVEGFLGEHSNLHVTFLHRDVTTTEVFFLKRKPQNNKLQTDLSDNLGAYKKEIFIYDYLLKEFEKNGSDTSFAAKCLFVVADEALIVENLAEKGFKLSDRHTPFNMAHAECALRALAAFHGAGIAYNLKKTIELRRAYTMDQEFPAIFEETMHILKTNPTGYLAKWWQGSFKTIRTIIDLMAGDAAFKEKFTSMVFGFDFGACFAAHTNYVKTCGHGDLWSNNMMFKYVDGQPIECRLLDFQICRHFYPAFDVVLLIYANTTPEMREKNLQKLYEYYYNALSAVLTKHGYQLSDLMTFEDFLATVRLVLRDAMIQILAGLICVHLPKELLNSFLEDGNTAKLEDFIFDNSQMAAEAFKTDENYRNIITKAFQDYYNILLSYENDGM